MRRAGGYHPSMFSIRLFKGGALVREIRTDESLLTVGRDLGSSIVLEDPDKLISRQHAAIERRDGVPYLIVHSRVNPVLVDGRVMRAGQTVALAEGARVTMSPYELVVTNDGDDPAPVVPAAPCAIAAPAAPAPAGPVPLAVQALQPHAPSEEPAADDPITETTTPWRRNADGGLDQATQAFLRGLGLAHLRIPPDEQVFFLERAGVVMQCVAEALVPMLVGRARARRGLALVDEEGVSANPLLGQTNPAQALAFLIDPSAQASGGPDPMQALREASEALLSHQDATLAGARAALLGMLQALDPEAFDAAAARAAGPLGINRRARAWEAFVEAHAALARQAAGDADALLRRDFLPAYLQRLGRADD